MALCKQCGAVLLEGRPTCASCGHPSPRVETPEVANETHRLLAEANLRRIRGHYDEAIRLCTDVLRKDSFNAVAHSLLGDIYAEQHNYREALGWYKLAVEFDPSVANRGKMEEMIDRVYQDEPREFLKKQALITPRPRPNKRSAGASPGVWLTLISWLSSLHPMIILGACTLIFAAIGGTLVYVLLPNDNYVTPGAMQLSQIPKKITRIEKPTAPRVSPPASPPATSPLTKSPAAPVTGSPGGIVIQQSLPPPSPTKPVPVPDNPINVPEVAPFRPNEEGTPVNTTITGSQSKALLSVINADLEQSRIPVIVSDVSVDPSADFVTLVFTIPHYKSLLEIKQALIYSGFQIIWIAQRHNYDFSSYMLEGNAYTVNGNNDHATPAFVAYVTQKQAQLAQHALDYHEIQQYLGKPWWRADLTHVLL